MNQFCIVGKIVDISDIVSSSSGTKICKLKVSVSKTAKEKGDEYETYEVVLFRNLAEEKFELEQFVAISGRLQANNYEKENNHYYNARLIGTNISYISKNETLS